MMNEVIRCYPTRIHELLELELNEKFKIKNYDGEYPGIYICIRQLEDKA
jgi:hypothetical protein